MPDTCLSDRQCLERLPHSSAALGLHDAADLLMAVQLSQSPRKLAIKVDIELAVLHDYIIADITQADSHASMHKALMWSNFARLLLI